MQKICTKIYHDFICEVNSSATTVSFLYILGPGESEKPCGLGELWGPGSHGGQRGQGNPLRGVMGAMEARGVTEPEKRYGRGVR